MTTDTTALQASTPHSEGLIFGMPENLYHADPSIGSTGLKALSQSAAAYWWASRMNALAERDDDDEPAHFRFGSALHKLVLEGEAAFHEAYAVEPELAPNVMRTADDLKGYLRRHGLPTTGSKPDLSRRVASHWTATSEGPCPIWDDMITRATSDGQRTLLKRNTYNAIVLSARMITANRELAPLLGLGEQRHSEGFNEVSVFWRERVQIANGVVVEVPCRARFDRLTLRSIVDLKTIANQKGLPLGIAIPQQIHALGYDVQANHYIRAREVAQQFARDGKVTRHGDARMPTAAWLRAFADTPPMSADEDPAKSRGWAWYWVFVQKMGAPICEARMLRRDSDIIRLASIERDHLLRRYAENRCRFGDAMWLHMAPVEELTASDLPSWPRMRPDELAGATRSNARGAQP